MSERHTHLCASYQVFALSKYFLYSFKNWTQLMIEELHIIREILKIKCASSPNCMRHWAWCTFARWLHILGFLHTTQAFIVYPSDNAPESNFEKYVHMQNSIYIYIYIYIYTHTHTHTQITHFTWTHFLFIYFFVTLCSVCDLSSLTRGRTWAHCGGSVKS